MNARLDIPTPTGDSAEAAIRLMREAFDAQRAAFAADMLPSRATRVDRLERILQLTKKHQAAIAESISADFGHRARQETELAEIFLVLSAVRHARRRVGRWMRPRRVATPLQMLPARSQVIPQPLGVVGVISPWNYPFQLGMLPAAEAIAAGNRVMLKPSELTPAFSELLRGIVAEFFAPEEFVVIPGNVAVGRAFSALAFDHLFFTGSTAIGRQVALAAAQNLTPVTLELGGKSPAIVDAGCDLAVATPRIAYGKLLNAGRPVSRPTTCSCRGARRRVVSRSSRATAMCPTIAANRTARASSSSATSSG
jgi:coniferyl-aldehyde dehydrogenase